MRYMLVLTVLLSSCAMKVTGVKYYTPEQRQYLIIRYWTEAQEILEDETSGVSSLIPHTIIDRWEWSHELLAYGRVTLAYGIFEASHKEGRVIKVVSWRPWTIRHEACHAILYYMQREDWDERCHEMEVFR